MQGMHGLQSVDGRTARPAIADAIEISIQVKPGGHSLMIKLSPQSRMDHTNGRRIYEH